MMSARQPSQERLSNRAPQAPTGHEPAIRWLRSGSSKGPYADRIGPAARSSVAVVAFVTASPSEPIDPRQAWLGLVTAVETIAELGPCGVSNLGYRRGLDFHAAHSYSLMRPPRRGRRLMCSREGSGTHRLLRTGVGCRVQPRWHAARVRRGGREPAMEDLTVRSGSLSAHDQGGLG
jgi:hypothetical protein